MPIYTPTDAVRTLSPPHSWKRVLLSLFLLTAGGILFAMGLNGIIIPQQFLNGGVIGVALIIHYLMPTLNTGFVYFLLNIPLLLLGWFTVSRRFILYTSYGMAVLSLATWLVKPGTLHIENPILAAILGGIVCGAGVGITLRSRGSAGGLDILAVYLNRKLGFRVGITFFLANAVVLAFGACLLDLEKALYSLVYVYVSGKVVDAVLTGFNQRKSVLIVSAQSQAIADQILNRLHRGVTFLEGIGGYSGEPKRVILSIITLTELSRLKEMVFDIDPDAFVVVNDTLEVLGRRHGSLRVY
jgi:uncharacterized membrane-anchored protein YitT (DUF2179 family)